MVKMVNFMVKIFYHKKIESEYDHEEIIIQIQIVWSFSNMTDLQSSKMSR